MISIVVMIFENKRKEIDVVLILLTDHHAGGDAVDVEEVKPIVYEAVGIPLFIRFIILAILNIIWKTEFWIHVAPCWWQLSWQSKWILCMVCPVDHLRQTDRLFHENFRLMITRWWSMLFSAPPPHDHPTLHHSSLWWSSSNEVNFQLRRKLTLENSLLTTQALLACRSTSIITCIKLLVFCQNQIAFEVKCQIVSLLCFIDIKVPSILALCM